MREIARPNNDTLYTACLLDLSPQLRVYVPDLEAMKTWVAPKAEKL